MHKNLVPKCSGDHEHQPLIEGRAKEAAIFPPEVCGAICGGPMKQKNEHMEQIRCLLNVNHATEIEEEDRQNLDGGQGRK